MKRTIGALVVLGLIGGAVWIGSNSGDDDAIVNEMGPVLVDESEAPNVSTPRCDEGIPFEPTYLPDGFGHEQFEGRFPGGRPLDDPRSTGGKRHQEQGVVHYRGSGGRAIEIRRPGTLFSELPLGDDAPTVQVLGTETANFAPTHPRGDDFIVQFTYPPGAGPHQWCSLYSLNEYGVSLPELKKVAIGLSAQRWPKGPFAHNCLPENADGRGDFDGDGSAEVVRFEPVFDAGGHAAWTVVLGTKSSLLEHTRERVDAECPEVIGATDVDQDGDDELFFDTGRGMTAALVDLLVFQRGKLREVTYRPKATTLYVGSSMAGRSDLRCFPTEGSPLFEIVTVDEQRQRVTSTNFSLRESVVVKAGTFPVRGDADGRLRCFGLRWTGY